MAQISSVDCILRFAHSGEKEVPYNLCVRKRERGEREKERGERERERREGRKEENWEMLLHLQRRINGTTTHLKKKFHHAERTQL